MRWNIQKDEVKHVYHILHATSKISKLANFYKPQSIVYQPKLPWNNVYVNSKSAYVCHYFTSIPTTIAISTLWRISISNFSGFQRTPNSKSQVKSGVDSGHVNKSIAADLMLTGIHSVRHYCVCLQHLGKMKRTNMPKAKQHVQAMTSQNQTHTFRHVNVMCHSDFLPNNGPVPP